MLQLPLVHRGKMRQALQKNTVELSASPWHNVFQDKSVTPWNGFIRLMPHAAWELLYEYIGLKANQESIILYHVDCHFLNCHIISFPKGEGTPYTIVHFKSSRVEPIWTNCFCLDLFWFHPFAHCGAQHPFASLLHTVFGTGATGASLAVRKVCP